MCAQRRLAQARRTVKEHVVKRFAPALSGRHRDRQVLLDDVLADVVIEAAGSKAAVDRNVVGLRIAGDDALGHAIRRLSPARRKRCTTNSTAQRCNCNPRYVTGTREAPRLR